MCTRGHSPLRQVNEAGRPMEGAASKLALSRLLGVSPLRAAQMYITPVRRGGALLAALTILTVLTVQVPRQLERLHR